MKDEALYERLFAQRDSWKPLTGGISNEVFAVEEDGVPRFVVKQINPTNDQLFILFDQFVTILQHLPTTLHVDVDKFIVIETFLQGGVVSDALLFAPHWPGRVYDVLDDIHNMSMPIAQDKNVILVYTEALTRYLVERDLNQVELAPFAAQARRCLDAIRKHFHGAQPLVFSHIDVQKYNMIYDDTHDSLQLIDWEYAGYTWRYFDQANFLFLLANNFLDLPETGGDDGVAAKQHEHVDQYRAFHDVAPPHNNHSAHSTGGARKKCLRGQVGDIRFNMDELLQFTSQRYGEHCSVAYLKDLMYTAGYLWLLWAYAKLDRSDQDVLYATYADQVKVILNSLDIQ